MGLRRPQRGGRVDAFEKKARARETGVVATLNPKPYALNPKPSTTRPPTGRSRRRDAATTRFARERETRRGARSSCRSRTASRARRSTSPARCAGARERAYDAIAPPVTRAYERTMAANAEYVVKDEARAKRLGREFVYTNLARVPGAIESATAEMETVRAAARRARAGEIDDAHADGGCERGVRGGGVRVVLRR